MTTAPAPVPASAAPERGRIARLLLGPRSGPAWVRPSLLVLLAASGTLYAGVFAEAVLGPGVL